MAWRRGPSTRTRWQDTNVEEEMMSLLSLPLTLDDDIFGHIRNINDLISLSWTSKEAYIRIRAFMTRVFRLHRLLSQFFNSQELETFQEFQRRSSLLVSGQALLFFLMRCEQESDQLDLFLHLQYKDLFCEWINSTRYVAEDNPLGLSVSEQIAILDYVWERPYKGEAWSGLMDASGYGGDTVEITVVLKGTSKSLVVHFSRGAPIQMILDLPATCLMNIATHSRIYSLYPRATFQRGISLLRPHWRSVIKSFVGLEPYLYLGFRFMDSCWNMFLPLFPFGRRRVGDKFTCVINTDLENEDSDIDYRLLTNSWLVYYLPKGVMDIHGMTIQSARLQDVYIVSDEVLRKNVVKLMGRLYSQSSNLPLPDFLDKELHQGVLDEIMVSQDSQLRLTYE